MKVKSLAKSKKNLLGNHIGTFKFPYQGNIYQYTNGWIIKPYQQEPIYLTIRQGYLLARWTRSKLEFVTLKEALISKRKNFIT